MEQSSPSLDADSPLFGLGEADVKGQDMTFVVSITGLDETSGQTMHARETFPSQALRFDHEFVDMISVAEGGERSIDYRRIHDTVSIAEKAL